MTRIWHMPYICFLALCFFALTGCGGLSWIPTQFASIEEAYSSGNPLPSMEGAPPESMQKIVFNAPFEDVYRAANVSVSQVQWLMQKESKAQGIILAIQILEMLPPVTTANCPLNGGANSRPRQRNYYYAVVIKEKGPKSTEITAVAKVQGGCEHKACFAAPSNNKACEAYASLHWATRDDSALPQLTQFMTFIRNNLIAAGLL